MLLHIADGTGEVLYCPECQSELWPAYWTEDGLEVGYWSDFAPPDGQAGLLVCGNLDCTHEEPVTFTDSPTDAVLWSQNDTYVRMENVMNAGFPQVWLQEYIAAIEQELAQNGPAKLRSALDWFQQELDERREEVDRWLVVAAQQGYPVTFKAEMEELAGQILASDAAECVLQTPDGQVRVLPKQAVWQMFIEYPDKPRKQRPDDKPIGFVATNKQFMVVGGYHLAYGHQTELGGYYRARCWDPTVAAALRLREKAPGYWEGAFRAEEIERFYWRHTFVKIRGHWLEQVERSDKLQLVWAETEDLEVGKALDMGPVYQREAGDFGCYDGDLVAYDDYFSIGEIEETRWEEEVRPLPSGRW